MTARLFDLLSAPVRPDLRALARAFAEAGESSGAVLQQSDGSRLSVCAAFPTDRVAEAALAVDVGQGVTGMVARTGLAIRLGSDAPRNPLHRQLLGIPADGAVARMCLPARGIDGQILGVVGLHRPTDRPYTDQDLTRLQPYADLLAMRLQVRNLRDAVDAHRDDRERLIAQAISAQEAERRRVANDLHDGVSTALASMSFHLNAAELSITAAESSIGTVEPAGAGQPVDGSGAARAMVQARSQIAAARALADLAYHQTRAAITGLHSLVLDDLGLVAALETLVQTAPGVVTELCTDPPERFGDLPDHAAAALFRIAQETVSNAVRHARATRVTVSLRRVEDLVVLRTADDGVGFDVRAQAAARSGPRADSPEQGHVGLSSIAERCALVGASMRITSMPGKGTSVIVELPVQPATEG